MMECLFIFKEKGGSYNRILLHGSIMLSVNKTSLAIMFWIVTHRFLHKQQMKWLTGNRTMFHACGARAEALLIFLKKVSRT